MLYSWGCGGHNCGLAQAVFTGPGAYALFTNKIQIQNPCVILTVTRSHSRLSEWKVPVITKRLNARYDWLNGRWENKQYVVVGAGDGCEPFPAAAGAVAWVSESGCSFFTKVRRDESV